MRPSLRARDVRMVRRCGSQRVPLSRTGEARDRGSENSSRELHLFLVDGNGMGLVFAVHSGRPYALLAFHAFRETALPLRGTGGRSTRARQVVGRLETKTASSRIARGCEACDFCLP